MMEEHYCGVSMPEGKWCDKPARFRNPNYGVPDSWFGYVEWLCAEHYDAVMAFLNYLNERTL